MKATYDLSPKVQAELRRLEQLSDKDIDLSEIEEIKNLKGFVHSKFYRPVKHRITIRLDADVLAWFKARSDKYQARINKALREYIQLRS